jgi:uncharacterized protein with HEPN domain
MLRDDSVLVNDILDAIEEIENFTDDIEYEDMMEDKKLQYALVHLLEVIGEAANQVSDDYKQNHNMVPWTKMIGMRNRLAHGYFSINMTIVWDTVKEDIPHVRDALRNGK